MKCFKCRSELITDGKNMHEFICPNCNDYTITHTAINIIPKTSGNDWESVLQNYVTEHANDKRIIIDSDIIHKLFGN
jgi:hypothetical protein